MTDCVREAGGEVITDILSEQEQIRRSWFGFGIVRGGRMTKVSGQAASYSPELGLVEAGSQIVAANAPSRASLAALAKSALRWSAAPLAIFAAASPAFSQSIPAGCVDTSGNGVAEAGETITCVVAAPTEIAGITTTADDVTIVIGDAGTPTSVNNPSFTGTGVFAASNAGSLTIDSSNGSVTGGDYGIYAINTGTGALSITTADTTGVGRDGILALNLSSSTDLTIDSSEGSVRGERIGIQATNNGSGTFSVTTADVTGALQNGISLINLGGDVTVDTSAGAVSGITGGIQVSQFGAGGISITTADVTGIRNEGIVAVNSGSGADVSIDSSAGSVIGGTRVLSTGRRVSGVFAAQQSAGTLNITVDQVSGGLGIDARATSGATTITLGSTAVVTGLTGAGIDAQSTGGAITVQGSSGVVVGATDGMYVRSTGGDITVDALDSVTGNAGDGLDLGSTGGAITVNAVDAVLGTGGNGILADSDGGDITITGNGLVGGVEGTAGDGINADARGGVGGEITITGNGNITGSNYGINTRTDGAGSITIDTSTGSVSGGSTGILARNYGSGAVLLTTADVTGFSGINVANVSTRTTDLTIDSSAGSISSGSFGISAINNGSGALSLTTADVTGISFDGIYARNSGTGLTIDTSSGGVSGARYGIRANQQSAGELNITVDQISGGIGIDANATTGATTITLASTAVVTGLVEAGIDARSTGGAITVQGSSGVVVGATDGMYVRSISGDITVDTLDSVTGNAGDGLDLASAGGAITVNAVDAIAGTAVGIRADSDGGDITITGNGLVGGIEGATGSGIFADAGGGSGGDIRISGNGDIGNGGINSRTDGAGSITIDTSTGNVTGSINASNQGSGAVTVTTADVTSNAPGGIFAFTRGLGLTIDSSAGSVSGRERGIEATNFGSGALSITTADATGAVFEGILASNGVSATDLTIDTSAGNVSGSRGILANSQGTGGLSLTTADVTGSSFDGIHAVNSAAGADMSIDTSAGIVSGQPGANFSGRLFAGILADQQSAGTLDITVDQVTGGVGIDAEATTGATTITLTSTALVTGLTGSGIDAQSSGGAITVQGSSGDVVGATDGMYVRSMGGDITVDTLDSVTGNAGDGLDLASAGGAITVNAVDAVLGMGGRGILADSDGGDITITGSGLVGGIEGTASDGILADASGGPGGAITIMGNGDINGSNNGIYAFTNGAGSITIDTSTSSITGRVSGINATNFGTGGLSVTTADVTGTGRDGISARNFGTDLSVDSSAGTIAGNGGITATNFGSGVLSLTTADVTGTGGDGISVRNQGTDLAVDTSGGSVSGAANGIYAYNQGLGTASVTTADVTSANGNGIYARNSSSGDSLSVDSSAGSVVGDNRGIRAINEGSGALSVITADASGTDREGITAGNSSTGTNLTINSSAGSVSGGTRGIYAVNQGSGALSVTTADVSGGTGEGISARNFSGTDLTVDSRAGSVSGGFRGINATNAGSGALTITTADVTGTTNEGIRVVQSSAGGSLTIDSSAGSVVGGNRGIYVRDYGGGSVASIIVDQVTGGTGIFSNTTSGATTITLGSTAVVTGTASQGIYGYSTGGSITVQGSSGDVVGATDGMYVRSSGGDITVDTLDSVTGNAGDGLDLASAGGAITVNAVDTITGTDDSGIVADSDGGDITITGNGLVGGISGTGANGITAYAGGGIGGAITITGNGNIAAGDDSIFAYTNGAGSITIDSSLGSVSGGRKGIFADNFGSGALSITTADVTGARSEGIMALNIGTNLIIDSSAGSVSGATHGILAINSGLGSLSLTTADVTGGYDGILAMNFSGTDLTIDTSAGDVSGARRGILARQDGSGVFSINTNGVTGSNYGIFTVQSGAGAQSIMAAGDVISTSSDAIRANGSGASLSITTAALVSGETGGIRAQNDGTGALTVNVNEVTSANGAAIRARNGSFSVPAGTDLTVTASGTVTGTAGIYANNGGTGDLSITTADVNATTSVAVSGRNYAAARNLTIDTTGGVVDAAYNGIRAANDGSGAVAVTTGDVNAGGYYAIYGRNYGTDLTIDTTAGEVTGSASGIYARSIGSGALSITTGNVTGSGNRGISIFNLLTELTVNTAAGAVSAENEGILAFNEGTGTLTITTADVTSNSRSGIIAEQSVNDADIVIDTTGGAVVGSSVGIMAAQNTGGDVTVDVNAVEGGVGIISTAATGDTLITLSSTAVVTGTTMVGLYGLSTTGDITVQGSSGTVTGATDGIMLVSAGGELTVGNIDLVQGNAGDGIDLASGGGAISVTDVDEITGVGGNGILADATGGAGGDILLTGNGDIMGSLAGITASADGAGTVTADLTGMTLGGVSGFAVSTEGGAVSVANSGLLSGGTNAFIASGANTGPITLTNTGTILDPVQFASGDDSFTNSGTFQVRDTSDFGAGTDMFDNLAGGTLAAPAIASLIGVETLSNAGLITLVNEDAAGSLTVSGDFIGNDGQLAIDIDFAGTSDKLIIGGAATGTTTIFLNDVSSAAGIGSGIVLVDAAGGSEEGAFELANQSLNFTPFVALDLAFDAANNDFLISRRFTSSVAEGAKLAEGAQSLWYRSTDAWTQHQASTRFDDENASPLWLTFYGNVASREDDTMGTGLMLPAANDLDYEQDFFGFQAGYDLASQAGDGFAAGITAGYLSSNIRFASRGNSARFDVFNIGLSASYSSGGFYADGLIKYDTISGNLSDPRAGGFDGDADGDALGVHAQLGYRFGDDGFFIEPQFNLDYQATNLDDIVIEDTRFDFGNIDGLRGIAGLRIGGQSERSNGTGIGYYLGASAVHEFQDGPPVRFSFGSDEIALSNNKIGTYGRIEAGMTLFGTGPLSGFIEAHGDISSSYTSYGGQAGVRIKF
ncbi:hypothetical protein [Erythrobacter sp. MTPC3]|uniref:hypothetical protein n=1 Tax=Erythrobacter sp. MTPC3 TaxID=3056564 RepID=UPI0036F38CEE